MQHSSRRIDGLNCQIHLDLSLVKVKYDKIVKQVKSSKTHLKTVLLCSAFWVPLVVSASSSSSMYLGAFCEATALWATFNLVRFFG